MTAEIAAQGMVTTRRWVFEEVPRVIAHRGASLAAPENTLVAIREAHAQGARWVEVDVKLSGDGVPYLMHDATLDRTTTGRGSAKGRLWQELAELDAGRWFDRRFAGQPLARLSDALVLLEELGMGINLELKPCNGEDEATAHAVIDVIARLHKPSRPLPLISSFSKAALAAAREAAQQVPRGLLVGRADSSTLGTVEALACTTLHVSASFCRTEWLRSVRAKGLPVLCYTVNDVGKAQKLLNAGAHAVFTDAPAVVGEALKANGIAI